MNTQSLPTSTDGIWNFNLWRICLLTKYYEEAKYNAAFDRCVDVMTRLIQKYGHQVLENKEADALKETECSDDDKQAQPLNKQAA